jgi:mannose-6-phosphate isomerase-like protein (cupin superfamily)
MDMEKSNVNSKLSLIQEYWNPHIVGELNGQYVKLAKLKDEFVWHHHEHEDELFYVISGVLKIAFRDKTIELHPHEFIIVPRGVEHKPIAEEEVCVMLFEPKSTLNTGNTKSELTREQLNTI